MSTENRVSEEQIGQNRERRMKEIYVICCGVVYIPLYNVHSSFLLSESAGGRGGLITAGKTCFNVCLHKCPLF